MKTLDFEITHNGSRYRVFIEMGLSHEFKNKTQARKFIEKYREVINDNVLLLMAINDKVSSLTSYYYPFMTARIAEELNTYNVDFNECYNRIYSPVANYVQFVQIRSCFNILESRMRLLKRYAQRRKRVVLLNQLYPWLKMYDMVYRSYNSDIEGLTNGVSYRTKLKRLSLTEPQENEQSNNSRFVST